MATYFSPTIKPIMDKTLRAGDKANWPLVTLCLDIKSDPPKHLEYISHLLDQDDAWLTKSPKTDTFAKRSRPEVGSMVILVEDKTNDIKQKFFLRRSPVRGRHPRLRFLHQAG